jgi:hypothetical protein
METVLCALGSSLWCELSRSSPDSHLSGPLCTGHEPCVGSLPRLPTSQRGLVMVYEKGANLAGGVSHHPSTSKEHIMNSIAHHALPTSTLPPQIIQFHCASTYTMTTFRAIPSVHVLENMHTKCSRHYHILHIKTPCKRRAHFFAFSLSHASGQHKGITINAYLG